MGYFDYLGLDVLKKCEILIRADHFRGKTANHSHFKALDFGKSPECSRVGYVGCGANYLNGKIPASHSAGVGKYPEVPLDEEQKKQAEKSGFPKEDIPKLGINEDVEGAIDAAVEAAMKEANELCKCCPKITIFVDCDGEDGDWRGRHAKMIEEIIERGGRPTDKQDEDAKRKAKEQAKCGKENILDCSTKKWSGWQKRK